MILLYHKVAPETPTYWWVSVDAFDRQMADLQGREVVTLDQYDPRNPNHVVITFDGVYENVYQYALPILRKWGYPFELFIVGDHVGGNNAFDAVEPLTRFASIKQLAALTTAGGRLQWHTASHSRLHEISSQRLAHELTIPAQLRARFPHPHFGWFAYPHGDHTPAVVDAVRARFQGALSCLAGNDQDPWQLNRVIVDETVRFTKSSVAIIIANYNYGRFVAEAIESVLSQTMAPDEVLVIDDCSIDGSEEIIARYADRVRFVRNSRNLGIIGNFNKAVSLTTSSYIGFLGADNRMRSDYVERCKAVLDRDEGLAVAYTDLLLFGPRASLLAARVGAEMISESITERWPVYLWRFREPSAQHLEQLPVDNFIHGSSMYRRQAFAKVGGYKPSNRAEDHDLFVRMVTAGWGAARVPFPLIEYRQHSLTQTNTVLSLQMELDHYRRATSALRAQMEELEQFRREAVAAMAALRQSRSWRLTAPLRVVGHLARGNVKPVVHGIGLRSANVLAKLRAQH